jgi:hypothetical protein
VLERGRGSAWTADASGSRKHEEVLGFLMGLGLAWAAQGTKSMLAMSTTSRLKKSSRQLVGRLARKVESDSPVGITGASGRLVDDLKTGGAGLPTG